MSAPDDGGPAFPMTGDPAVDFDRGMSLRDYFAIHSDVPFAVALDAYTRKYPDKKGIVTAGELANYRALLRYLEADAMLVIRYKSYKSASSGPATGDARTDS